MIETKLFIARTPKLRNGNFETNAVEYVGSLISDRHYEYFDKVLKDNSLTYDNTLSPVQPVPFNNNGTNGRYISQDIGADKGRYTIEIEVSVIDETQPYRGLYCVGIGNTFVYLETPGNPAITNVSPSGISTAPGTYVFDLAVNNLNDTYFGNKFNITSSGMAFRSDIPISNLGISKVAIRNFEPFNYQEIDLYDDIDIPITYNIADVKDISKKDSNYSFNAYIPNTNNNAQIFNHIHNVADFDSTFEFLNPYPCYIEKNGNRVFEGFFRLTDVVNDYNTVSSYKCDLYSNVVEFFNQLGEQTLIGNEDSFDDLDFSEYKTELSITEIQSRLEDQQSSGKDWGFTLINKTGHNLISGHQYDDYKIEVHRLTPFLYVKEILDKIFEKTKFNYVSEFLNDTVDNNTQFKFENIIYPKLNTEITENIYNRIFYSGEPTLSTPYISVSQNTGWLPSTTIQTLETYSGTNFLMYDTYSAFSESKEGTNVINKSPNAFQYICNVPGLYSLNIHIPITLQMQLYDATPITPEISTYTGDVYTHGNYGFSLITKLMHYHNDTATSTVVYQDTFSESYGSQYYSYDGLMSLAATNFDIDTNIVLNQGDVIYIEYDFGFDECYKSGNYRQWIFTHQIQTPHFVFMVYPNINVNSKLDNNYFVSTLISTQVLGGEFDPTNILDKNVKKSDLVNSIIKKFNLYIEDVSGKKIGNSFYPKNTLRIEPRNMFYELDNKVIDLTECVDTKTIEFKRLDDYVQKKIVLNDKDDGEYFIEQYKDNTYTPEEYGEKIVKPIIPISDPEEVKIETIFGQTMSPNLKVENEQQTVYSYALQMPAIIHESTSEKVFSPRILFLFKNYTMYDNKYNNHYKSERINVLNGETNLFYTFTYNLVDHFATPFGYEDEQNQIYLADLNFGWPHWYYQYNAPFIWNNAYNRFYSEMVNNYNSQNSRILKCEMYLDSYTISNIVLSNTILVNDVAYHINKIIEWTNESEPCKVELIRIIDSQSNSGNIIEERNSIAPNVPVPQPIINQNVQEQIERQEAATEKLASDAVETNKKIFDLLSTISKEIKSLDERVKKLEER